MGLNKKNIFTGMYKNQYLFGIIILSFFFTNAWCKIPELSISSEPVSCYGKSDGSIILNLDISTSDNIEIVLLDPLSKQLASVNQTTPFPYKQSELPSGIYHIKLSANGETNVYSVEVESPEKLKADKITIEELSENNSIASIKAHPDGGTPPYVIRWSENTNNQKGIIAKDLPPGVYKCTIDDRNHCGPVSATIFLFETEIEKFLSNRDK